MSGTKIKLTISQKSKLRFALDICSNNVMILNELGVVLIRLGRSEEALPYFNNGSKLISMTRGLIPMQAVQVCRVYVGCM